MMGDVANWLYTVLGGGVGAASLVVAIIALFGTLGGAAASYLVASRAVYINSITAERSKWIDKLRSNLAEYSFALARLSLSLAEAGMPSRTSKSIDDIIDALKNINRIVSVIQLQLNPWGAIDRNILSLIEAIVVRADTDHQLVDRADKLVISHSQWLLKAEWEKVKFEARGPVYRLFHRGDERARLARYVEWAKGKGSLTPILAELAREKRR